MSKIDMELYKEIGIILKNRRNKKKISLDQLAYKLNYKKTKSTLKRYEDGKSRIDINIFRDICHVLDLDYKDVINIAEKNISDFPLGDYQENAAYLKDKPNLLELYNEILDNDNLAILFDKARELNPQDLERILMIIDTFKRERK